MNSEQNEINAEELEKRIMDLLVMLYSDQTGKEYTYRAIGEKENAKE